MQRLPVTAAMRQRTQHELDIGDFDRPRGACLEVVQIHFGKILSGQRGLRIEAQAGFDIAIVGCAEACAEIMVLHIDGGSLEAQIITGDHTVGKRAQMRDLLRREKVRLEHDRCLQQGFLIAIGETIAAVPVQQLIGVCGASIRGNRRKQSIGDALETVFQPFFVLVGQLVIRNQNRAQGIRPQGKVGDIFVRRRDTDRQLFFVFLVELRDDLSDDLCCLVADIAFFVYEQL